MSPEEIIHSANSPHRGIFSWLEECHRKGNWEKPLESPQDYLETLEGEVEEAPESVVASHQLSAAVEAARALRAALGLAPLPQLS